MRVRHLPWIFMLLAGLAGATPSAAPAAEGRGAARPDAYASDADPTLRVLVATASPGTAGANVVANDAPALSLSSPNAGALFDTATYPTVPIRVNVQRADPPLQGVQIMLCKSSGSSCIETPVMAGVLDDEPYALDWKPPRAPISGTSRTVTPYFVWAVAQSASGQSLQTAPTSITVILTRPPRVVLEIPDAEIGLVAPAVAVLVATGDYPEVPAPGTVTNMDFFDGDVLIGSLTSPNREPNGFAFVWRGPAIGAHTVWARATDSAGAIGASDAVPLFVVEFDPSPLVAISSPVTGQVFPPENPIPLVATASSPAGSVKRVEFMVGNTVIATALSAPYQASWVDPPPGLHAIVARAFDDLGMSAASIGSQVRVLSAPRPPIVVLKSPAPGTRLSANAAVMLEADAASPDGAIGRVDFVAGSNVIGSATQPPYTFSWTPSVAGSANLMARAYDLKAQTGVSAPAVVSIDGRALPGVSLTSPVSGASYTAPATVAILANASSPSGAITQVDFFSGAELIGSSRSPPFQFTWTGVPVGSYRITAKATDIAGAKAASDVVPITVTAGPTPPFVSIVSPTAASRFAMGEAMPITANANAPGRAVARVQFFVDGSSVGAVAVGGAPALADVTFVWTAPAAGDHKLTAGVQTVDGAAAISAPVDITVADLGIRLIEPVQGQSYLAPGEIRMVVETTATGATIAQVDFYGDDVMIGSVAAPPFVFVWNGASAGNHTVSARVRDSAGLAVSAPSVGVAVATAPAIQLDPGMDGATVADDSASVSGTVKAPANSAVVVNGKSAALDLSGRFFVDGIRLRPGANPVTVSVHTMDAAAIRQTLTINSNGTAPFTVALDDQQGWAPFATQLTIANRANVPFQRIDLDYEGDGVVDRMLTELPGGTAVLALSYPNPGTYRIRVSVFGPGNALIYETTRTVLVQNAADLGRRVLSVYDALVDRMVANNPAAALRCFTGEARGTYGAVFDALSGRLPEVARQLGKVVNAVVDESTAELALGRDGPTGREIYMMHMIRGGDGVWRIETM